MGSSCEEQRSLRENRKYKETDSCNQKEIFEIYLADNEKRGVGECNTQRTIEGKRRRKTVSNLFVWMDGRTRKKIKKIKISLEQERIGHIQKEHVT